MRWRCLMKCLTNYPKLPARSLDAWLMPMPSLTPNLLIGTKTKPKSLIWQAHDMPTTCLQAYDILTLCPSNTHQNHIMTKYLALFTLQINPIAAILSHCACLSVKTAGYRLNLHWRWRDIIMIWVWIVVRRGGSEMRRPSRIDHYDLVADDGDNLLMRGVGNY